MTDNTQKTIEIYNKIASSYAQNVADLFPQVEADKFLSLMQPGSAILDIGCGSGRDVRIFTELGFKVTGIDLSEKLLAIARKENPGLDFEYMDMRATSFPDESFGGIWANAVLHHLEEPEMKITIQEWGRVCKPLGILYIATKMDTGKPLAPDEFANNQDRKFTRLTSEKLKNICETAGFEQINIYSYNELQRNKEGRDVDWIVGFFRKTSFT